MTERAHTIFLEINFDNFRMLRRVIVVQTVAFQIA